MHGTYGMEIEPQSALLVAARGVARFFLLAEESGNAVDNFIERRLRAEAGEGVEFIDARDAAHHVLEAWFVGLIVGHKFDGRIAAGALFDQLSEAFDRDFFGVADVDDLADGAIGVHQANEAFDSVADIAEAAGLLAVAVNLMGPLSSACLTKFGKTIP